MANKSEVIFCPSAGPGALGYTVRGGFSEPGQGQPVLCASGVSKGKDPLMARISRRKMLSGSTEYPNVIGGGHSWAFLC